MGFSLKVILAVFLLVFVMEGRLTVGEAIGLYSWARALAAAVPA